MTPKESPAGDPTGQANVSGVARGFRHLYYVSQKNNS